MTNFWGEKQISGRSVNVNKSELPRSHTNDDVGATELSAFTLQPGLISVEVTDTNCCILKELGIASTPKHMTSMKNKCRIKAVRITI